MRNYIVKICAPRVQVAATTKPQLDGVARSGARLLAIGGAATVRAPGCGDHAVLDVPLRLPNRGYES